MFFHSAAIESITLKRTSCKFSLFAPVSIFVSFLAFGAVRSQIDLRSYEREPLFVRNVHFS